MSRYNIELLNHWLKYRITLHVTNYIYSILKSTTVRSSAGTEYEADAQCHAFLRHKHFVCPSQ